MTPAKLLALEEERGRTVAALTFPVDKLGWLYVNGNRDPGETAADGRVVRAPADPLDIEEFRTYGRKLKSLAAKDRWDPSIQGARASRDAFQAWAGQAMGQVFIPTKE